MTTRIIAALCCTTAICAFSAVQPAYAQQAAQPAASSQTGGLEEIVVTARKTEEKLQTAPLSVTAITAAKLDAQNITTADGLNGFVPNLNISKGAGYGTSLNVTIRGVNQADNVLTNDAPVAMYIDGVYNGRQIGGLFDLVDLAQVEVLRGPQGTLFGRNTTGGAIQITTRSPEPDFWVSQRVGYASNNEFESRTEVNTGDIGNTGLKALLAYSHHQMDGWVHNPLVNDSEAGGSLDSNAFFFALRGDLTDDLSFDYKIDYTDMHDQASTNQLTYVSPVDQAFFGSSPKFGGSPLVVSPNRLDSVTSYDSVPTNHDVVYGHSLTINYDVNDALHLKSISAYRSLASDSHNDEAGQGLLLGPVLTSTGIKVQQVHPFITLCPGNTPVFASNSCDTQRQYQISQEFNASVKLDEFKFVGGLYFFDEKVHEQDPEFLTIAVPTAGPVGAAILQGFGVPAPFIGYIQNNPLVIKANNTIGFQAYPVTNYYAESKSFAAYEQTSYKPDFLDDKFEFTAGLRYTFDQKTIHQRDFAADNPSVYSNYFNGAKNFHNLSWMLSAKYQFTDDVMGYASVSNAYKSGGFSARTHANEYNPEINTSYEFGLKSEFFDHTLRLNADVFYMKYENLQVNFFTEDPVTHAAASITQNAGAATYKGGELSVDYVPDNHWKFDGSFGYVDPNFQQYMADINGQQVNIADQATFNYVSKMTWNVGAEYDFEPFTFGDLSARVDFAFASPKTFHPVTLFAPLNPIIKSSNYHDLKAYVLLKNIETEYGKWEAKVYGSNLLDEDQRYAGIDFEIVSGLSYFGNNTYNRPRTVGFQLTYTYEPAQAPEAPAAYVPPPAVAPAPAVAHSYMVFFDFDKSDLTSDATAIVDQAARNAAPAKVTEITVTGHTDTVGSDAYNMRLSKRRAESVSAQLQKDGIPASEIAIVAMGKRDLLVPTKDGVREPQNRRVTIVYGGGANS